MLPIPARAGRRRSPSYPFGTRIAFINWIHPFVIQPLPNTEVRVIYSSFQTYQLVYQVRIMSGANFGDAAWVQGDFVSATSTAATTTADE
jgi:hypothetical protein